VARAEAACRDAAKRLAAAELAVKAKNDARLKASKEYIGMIGGV
jgi:hypothetical protein